MNGVTVAQALVVAERRQAALPAELAGSLVLSAADALVSSSLNVGAHELVVLDDGTVRVCGGTPSDESSSEKSLRDMLDKLLLCSSSVTPALLRASRRPSRGNIAELIRELEVALIPTNRGAARRALARLCREVTVALEHSPELKQAAEPRACVETRVESAPVPVVAPPPPVISEPIEEMEIELELSPSLPAVPAVPVAAPAPIRRESPAPRAPATFEIPDLEIPGATKAELILQGDWQPVEHTVRLEIPSRSVMSRRPVTSPPVSVHVPTGVSLAAAVQLDYVELSDEDVREATVELPLKPLLRHRAPPKPPLRARCSPVDAVDSSEAPLIAIEAQTNSEHETAEPFLLVVPSLGHEARGGEENNVDPPRDSEVAEVGDDSVPLQTNQAVALQWTEWIPDAIECESSDLLESYPLSLEVVATNELDLEPESLAQSIESLLSDASDLGDIPEPVVVECEHTSLEVVTFTEEAETLDAPPRPVVVTEPECALSLDQVQPIVWRPQSIAEPAEFSDALDWPELEANSETFPPMTQALESEPEPPEIKPWEPHRYSADLQPLAPAPELEARIAAFAVRKQGNARELARGLRSLAGLEQDAASEVSVTPPPIARMSELSEHETSESNNPMVRTLVGLGAVGTLFVLVTFSAGTHGHAAAAAESPVIHSQPPSTCVASISVADLPAGTSVRVTQAGKAPSHDLVQVGRTPLKVDGLLCDTPAELLVKIADRGWLRIPVESSKLARSGNPESIRVASLATQ